MTAALARSAPSNQIVVAAYAGAMAMLAAVLFLLAIEQKQAVDAWRGLRHALSEISPVRLDKPAISLSDFTPARAADAVDRPLRGRFTVQDPAGARFGAIDFDGARVRFGSGQTLRTAPLRIAEGREPALRGVTFAQEFDARPDAQIELRRFIPLRGAAEVDAIPVCDSAPPGAVALLHRRDSVDLTLYRQGAIPGAATARDQTCGTFRLRAIR